MKFYGEKEVTVNFLGENEVIVNFLGKKEVIKKPPGEKEAMVIDENPFPPAASINITAIDSRAMLTAKKARRFSPSARVRKVWIPKQYFTYKNDLVAKERVSAAREWKKGMNDPSKRKISQIFIVPPIISPLQEWHVVQHKKFPQKLTRTRKRKMHRQSAMEKRQLPGEMLQGKPK